MSKPVDMSEEVRQTIKESMNKSYETLSAALSPIITNVGQMTGTVAKILDLTKLWSVNNSNQYVVNKIFAIGSTN